MIVEILKNCKTTGVKAGELYHVRPYHLDPTSKVTLIKRIPDGYDPCCNEYCHNVRLIRESK